MWKTESDLLTIHKHGHIWDKIIDDLEGLRCGQPRFILC
jgi:hypothetical protein